MGDKNTQSRKWLLTINNPSEHGITHETIKETMLKFKSVVYWCMGDEIGDEKQTPHIHLYMASKSGIRFSTVKTKFPTSHIDYCNGTSVENRAYVFKEGLKFNRTDDGRYKYTDSKKCVHTGIHYDDTNEEFGEMPMERPGARNDLADLYDMIKSGMTTFEILEQCPQFLFQADKIDRVRREIHGEQYNAVWRDVQVIYVWGETGTGKTSGIVEKHGYKDLYIASNYRNPFDSYKGQDILVLDEFRSSISFSDLLRYLDGHPVELQARFYDRQACYHTVYIVSNIDIRKQYKNIQEDDPLGWDAFLRRIDTVKYYDGETVYEMPLRTYMEKHYSLFKFKNPFEFEGEVVDNE